MQLTEAMKEALRKMDAGEYDNDTSAKRTLEKEIVKMVNLCQLYGISVPQAASSMDEQIAMAWGSKSGIPLPHDIRMADQQKRREMSKGKEMADQRYEQRRGRFGAIRND